MLDLRLSPYISLLWGVMALGGILGEMFGGLTLMQVCINLLLVFSVPFVMLGLSVIHAYANSKPKSKWFILVVCYILLVLTPFVFVVLILGLVEDSFKIKRHYRKRD